MKTHYKELPICPCECTPAWTQCVCATPSNTNTQSYKHAIRCYKYIYTCNLQTHSHGHSWWYMQLLRYTRKHTDHVWTYTVHSLRVTIQSFIEKNIPANAVWCLYAHCMYWAIMQVKMHASCLLHLAAVPWESLIKFGINVPTPRELIGISQS